MEDRITYEVLGYNPLLSRKSKLDLSKGITNANINAIIGDGAISGNTIDNNENWTDDVAANDAQEDAAQAILDAATAQATADSKIITFYQAGVPTSTDIGDLWIDTDDGNRLYRAESVGADQITAGEWVEIQDTDIAQAIADAGTAQSTADGKIVTFYQDGEPTAEGIGDIWFDTNDTMKQHRWSGSAWISVVDTDIAQAITDASNAQATADGKIITFYQDGEPTGGESSSGDLWIDTNDGNKLYRYSGAAWVEIQDNAIQTALTDASNAQTTADGKIVTFFQDAQPTADGTGDIWIDTDDNNKPYRWSGSVWDAMDNPPEWADVLDGATNKPADNADVTKTIIDGGLITTGYITLNTAGNIKSGKANYADTDAGWWLGNDSGTPKFNIGNSTDYFKWDGSNVKMLCSSENAIHIQYGSDILLEHGGDIKFTSVAAPTACTATLIETDTGNVDAGEHKYKITYVNEAGETELGVASNTVTTDATHKQVNLTDIPISTSGSVTKRKIYRTKVGGTSYYLLTTIANNTGTTYIDNTADADLMGNSANMIKNSSFGKIIVDNIVALSLGFGNNKVGLNVLTKNTTGSRNTAFGFCSLHENIGGSGNIAIGENALYNNQEGGLNTAVGLETLYSNTTGNHNTAIGYYSLYANTTGHSNTANGAYSLESNTTGYRNTATGYSSLKSNTTGYCNTAIGHYSLYANTTGHFNTAIGAYSFKSNTEGDNNVAIGYYSLYANTTGYYNTAIGYYSLYANTTGHSNTANGLYSLKSNTTGYCNTAIGYYSLQANTSGDYNIALGNFAGKYETDSNAFYVNTRDRTDTAGDKTKSLMYGVMAATQTDQQLRLTASVGINTVDFGSGKIVLALANATTIPSVNPTGGGVIYCEGGALKYRGSGGSITTIALA